MTDTSSVVTPAAVDRLSRQAASQTESDTVALALAGQPQTYPSGPSAQDQHPAAQRLSSNQWAGKTSTLNNAQAAQGDADVYVTVPVDKVVTSGGSSKVAPVYASSKGYQARPGDSAGSIPPTVAAGRPY
jgi:hypothetical protein